MNTFAAVDIGSNAIRVHISHLLETNKGHEFKTVEYMRIPLRLGEDVFTIGKITQDKIHKLVLLGQSLRNLFKLYDVTDSLVCATSAMREATNHKEVVEYVYNCTGFKINVIDGETEAEYTQLALKSFITSGSWLHIDVGGGSTEINLYNDGKKLASHSFRIGAVRMLMKEDVSNTQQEMLYWVKAHVPDGKVYSLGTGGSIGKIYEMAKITNGEPISLEQITEMIQYIDRHSIEDRINILKLNPDRADVIVPASDIYLSVMQSVGATIMVVPKVGLSDGMLEVMISG